MPASHDRGQVTHADGLPMRVQVSSAIAQSQSLVELVAMREQLHQLWMRSGASTEQLVADLHTWLKTAEASNSATLCEFAAMVGSVRA